MRYVLMIMMMALCVNCMAQQYTKTEWLLYSEPEFKWQGDTAFIISTYSPDSQYVEQEIFIAPDLKNSVFNVAALGFSPYSTTRDSTVMYTDEFAIKLGCHTHTEPGWWAEDYKAFVSIKDVYRDHGIGAVYTLIRSADDVRVGRRNFYDSQWDYLKKNKPLICKYDEATDTWTRRYDVSLENFYSVRRETRKIGFKTQVFVKGDGWSPSDWDSALPDVICYNPETGQVETISYYQTTGPRVYIN